MAILKSEKVEKDAVEIGASMMALLAIKMIVYLRLICKKFPTCVI